MTFGPLDGDLPHAGRVWLEILTSTSGWVRRLTRPFVSPRIERGCRRGLGEPVRLDHQEPEVRHIRVHVGIEPGSAARHEPELGAEPGVDLPKRVLPMFTPVSFRTRPLRPSSSFARIRSSGGLIRSCRRWPGAGRPEAAARRRARSRRRLLHAGDDVGPLEAVQDRHGSAHGKRQQHAAIAG